MTGGKIAIEVISHAPVLTRAGSIMIERFAGALTRAVSFEDALPAATEAALTSRAPMPSAAEMAAEVKEISARAGEEVLSRTAEHVTFDDPAPHIPSARAESVESSSSSNDAQEARETERRKEEKKTTNDAKFTARLYNIMSSKTLWLIGITAAVLAEEEGVNIYKQIKDMIITKTPENRVNHYVNGKLKPASDNLDKVMASLTNNMEANKKHSKDQSMTAYVYDRFWGSDFLKKLDEPIVDYLKGLDDLNGYGKKQKDKYLEDELGSAEGFKTIHTSVAAYARYNTELDELKRKVIEIEVIAKNSGGFLSSDITRNIAKIKAMEPDKELAVVQQLAADNTLTQALSKIGEYVQGTKPQGDLQNREIKEKVQRGMEQVAVLEKQIDEISQDIKQMRRDPEISKDQIKQFEHAKESLQSAVATMKLTQHELLAKANQVSEHKSQVAEQKSPVPEQKSQEAEVKASQYGGAFFQPGATPSTPSKAPAKDVDATVKPKQGGGM
jgi:hypothetical protein